MRTMVGIGAGSTRMTIVPRTMQISVSIAAKN
jgi:hypothetical protein